MRGIAVGVGVGSVPPHVRQAVAQTRAADERQRAQLVPRDVEVEESGRLPHLDWQRVELVVGHVEVLDSAQLEDVGGDGAQPVVVGVQLLEHVQ